MRSVVWPMIALAVTGSTAARRSRSVAVRRKPWMVMCFVMPAQHRRELGREGHYATLAGLRGVADDAAHVGAADPQHAALVRGIDVCAGERRGFVLTQSRPVSTSVTMSGR